MTRRPVAVLAFALLLAACGDGAGDLLLSGTSLTSSTTTGDTVPPTTSAPSTTAAAGHTYPPEAVEAYLDGCAGGPEDLAFCRCTIEEFQQRLTFEEFLAVRESEAGGGVVAEVSRVCRDQSGPGEGSATTTTAVSEPISLDQLTELTIVDLEDYWGATLPASYGVAYEEVAAAFPYLPSQGNHPQCGPDPLPREVYEQNAFYCRVDDFVAWDAEELMPGLYAEFGDFAVSLVLAHEWGHAIQARVGTPQSLAPIIAELQADCLAGAWAAHVDAGESENLALEPGDLNEAMAGYLLFGDPPITAPTDPAAHGSAFDRVNAFRDGFSNGVDACRQYPDGRATVVDIPFTPEELQTGGDLPLSDTAPLLVATLESFWESAYPQVFGGDWVPVSDLRPYSPSSGELPACGDRPVDPDLYLNNAFYCRADDYVAWDDENLFPSLYQEIGDFAIGMVLAHEWATAVQARAGLQDEGVEAELQADCFTGVWTAAMVPPGIPIVLADGTETSIALSSEDLAEGVAGFLLFGDDPATGEQIGGTAFERFDAFQQGFFGGAEQCTSDGA